MANPYHFREAPALLRSLSIIATVAALSTAINHLEVAQAERQVQPHSRHITWVRTVDGWEPSTVLIVNPVESPPSLHPFLVAIFELGASLFVLLAFPYRKSSTA